MIGTLASGWKGLGASAVFCTTVYDCSRKSALGSQPIKCKPKTDHELMTRVFSCFRQFVWFYFDFFPLARYDIFLSYNHTRSNRAKREMVNFKYTRLIKKYVFVLSRL